MSLAHWGKKCFNLPAILAEQTGDEDNEEGLLTVIDVASWISDDCAGCDGADRKNYFGCGGPLVQPLICN